MIRIGQLPAVAGEFALQNGQLLADLLDAFALQTPNLLSFIRQDDRYSREALSGDLESLRSYYMDRGFADFQIESTQVAISPGKEDIFITVNLIEGDRYQINDVRLAGELVRRVDGGTGSSWRCWLQTSTTDSPSKTCWPVNR